MNKKIFLVFLVILMMMTTFSITVSAATVKGYDEKYDYEYYYPTDMYDEPYKYYVIEEKDNQYRLIFYKKDDSTTYAMFMNKYIDDITVLYDYIWTGKTSSDISFYRSTYEYVKHNVVASNLTEFSKRPALPDYNTTLGKLFYDNNWSGSFFFSVIDEIISVLPVLIAFLISFLSIDKAIRFVRGVIHSA